MRENHREISLIRGKQVEMRIVWRERSYATLYTSPTAIATGATTIVM
jgi:hypothetical protein